MPVVKVVYKHRGLVYRMHDENKRFRENYLRRRAIVRSQNIRMLEDEKRAVQARLERMPPQTRAEFLRLRMQQIEQRLKEENSGY